MRHGRYFLCLLAVMALALALRRGLYRCRLGGKYYVLRCVVCSFKFAVRSWWVVTSVVCACTRDFIMSLKTLPHCVNYYPN